jgi:GNAT superfamily N-acetyltransferase
MDLGDPALELALLGWPGDEVTLRLDYRRFSYAGKFVVGRTGKAVVRLRSAEATADLPPIDEPLPPGLDADAFDAEVVAAVAFDADRTDPDTLRLRYVTVRRDRRGEGLGPRLARFVTDRAHDRGYDRVRIAVNNPFAYEALHKAGFAWTGEETGLAELVLEHPPPVGRSGDDASTSAARDRYRAGLDRYRDRDLGRPEASFLARKAGAVPPRVIDTGRERADGTDAGSATDDSGN